MEGRRLRDRGSDCPPPDLHPWQAQPEANGRPRVVEQGVVVLASSVVDDVQWGVGVVGVEGVDWGGRGGGVDVYGSASLFAKI